MTASDFFGNLAMFTDAPGGIATLRELILQLAVQGKLGEQCESDEPVALVLERIARIRGSKYLTRPAEPTDGVLPRGWAMVRMNQIADHRLGKMLDSAKNRGELVPYLRNTNVQWSRFVLDDVKEMRFHESEFEEYEVRVGDLLICEGGEPGRCAVWTDSTRRLFFQKAIHRVRPLGGVSPFFLALRLQIDALSGRLNEQFTGATIRHFTGQELARYCCPLPPLAEQKRIVAKVDRLMATCDALEAQQQARHAVRSRLHATLLGNLQTAANAADFARAWQRLRDHFVELFTPGEAALDAVAHLRQTILQLAVQGKLVPQDAGDEPVSQFVSKIDAAKSEMSDSRKPKKVEPALPMNEAKPPFGIPPSWTWKRFGEVTICRDGERVPIESGIREARRGDFDYYGASGVIDKIDAYLFDKPLLLIGEDGANLVNRSTPIAFIATGKYWVNNHAHVLDSISVEALRYLEIFINAIDLKPYLTGTAQPKMNQAKMNSILIALPPEKEQQRIVAKVQQLMAQCDALEASLKEAATVSERWGAAAVRCLLEAAGSGVLDSAAVKIGGATESPAEPQE